MLTNVRITVPDDCGNAPKKVILRDFNVSLIIKDYTGVLEKQLMILLGLLLVMK